MTTQQPDQARPDEREAEERSKHPLSIENRSGFTDHKGATVFTNDRVKHLPTGRFGYVDEALHDGDAFVTFEDDSHETVKWAQLERAPSFEEKPEPERDERVEEIRKVAAKGYLALSSAEGLYLLAKLDEAREQLKAQNHPLLDNIKFAEDNASLRQQLEAAKEWEDSRSEYVEQLIAELNQAGAKNETLKKRIGELERDVERLTKLKDEWVKIANGYKKSPQPEAKTNE